MEICPNFSDGINIVDLPCPFDINMRVKDFKCKCFKPNEMVIFSIIRGILKDNDFISPSSKFEEIFIVSKSKFSVGKNINIKIKDKDFRKKLFYVDEKVISSGIIVVDDDGKYYLLYGFFEDSFSLKNYEKKVSDQTLLSLVEYFFVTMQNKNKFLMGKNSETVLTK